MMKLCRKVIFVFLFISLFDLIPNKILRSATLLLLVVDFLNVWA